MSDMNDDGRRQFTPEHAGTNDFENSRKSTLTRRHLLKMAGGALAFSLLSDLASPADLLAADNSGKPRWFDYGRHGNIMGDEEWGLLKPGSKGWVFGFKYVPAKNIEWETMYEIADMYSGFYGEKDQQYKRDFIRTQVDFYF